MGIPGFQKWLLGNFPEIVRVQGNKFGQVYDHVAFDMNQIIHKAARRAKDRPALASVIFRELDQILKSCVPRKSIFFAFDGPGPLAKLLTQRKRRNKVRKGHTDASGSEGGKSTHGAPCIDGVQFTPGVDMVYFVRDLTEYWAYTRLQNDRKYRNVDIRISGADVAGEGELKIVDLCRSGYVGEMESIIVVGGDADIVLQGLATIPIRNFFVYLHHFGTGKGKKRNYIISVWELVRAMERLFPGQSSGVRIDFILLSMMNGNDYIPKIRGVSLGRLWHRYCRLKSIARGGKGPLPFLSQCLIDAEQRTFNWAMFHALIDKVGARVPTMESISPEKVQLGNDPETVSMGEAFGMKEPTHIFFDESNDEPGDTVVYTGNEDGVPMDEFEALYAYADVGTAGEASGLNQSRFGDSLESAGENDSALDDDDDGGDIDTNDVYEEDEIADVDEDEQHIENLVAIAGDSTRFYDTERYFRTLLWTLHMYIDGYCSDFTFQYGKSYGPSCDVLAKYIKDHDGTPFVLQAPVSDIPALLPHQAALAMLPKQAVKLLPVPLQSLVQDPAKCRKIFLENDAVNIPALVRAVENIPESAYKVNELQRTVPGKPFLLRLAAGKDRLRFASNPWIQPPGPRFDEVRALPLVLRLSFRVTISPPCYPWPYGSMRGIMNLPYLTVGGNQLPGIRRSAEKREAQKSPSVNSTHPRPPANRGSQNRM